MQLKGNSIIFKHRLKNTDKYLLTMVIVSVFN